MARVLCLAVLLSLCPVFPLRAQPAELILLDANDTVVGNVLQIDSQSAMEVVQVALELDGNPVVLDLSAGFGAGDWVAPGEFGGDRTPVLYYESADCTGDAYIAIVTRPNPVVPLAYPNNAGGLTVFMPSGEPPQSVDYQSFMRRYDDTCETGASTREAYPAYGYSPGFTPPYRIEAVVVPAAPLPTVLSVPAVSPGGLALLALALVAGGVFVMARRG